MSITKVVPIHSDQGSLPDHAGAFARIRRAMQETAPAESLMGQLRDIIIGPQVRLSEARFEEMLDILDEQKDHATARLDVFADHLADAVRTASEMTGALEEQQQELSGLAGQLEAQVSLLRKEQEAALGKLRGEVLLNMEMLGDTLRSQVESLEMNMRSGLLDVSSSLVVHIAEEDKRWDREREHALSTLEQRIAQWRAEIDDDRQADMAELATSMVDIGQRLMALRKN